jgi:hypothetical protein
VKAHKGKLIVLALVVMVVAAALVVPFASGAVARVGGDGSTAALCQSGFACGGAPVAIECQSGHACGGVIIARVVKNAVCQSGTACGG